MKLPVFPSHMIARFGLAIGMALLAGALLTVSIAVSAETARPRTHRPRRLRTLAPRRP